MSGIPRHRRGLRDNYDPIIHEDVVYYATDTLEIIFNGDVYGQGASAVQVDNLLRALALKQDLILAGTLLKFYTNAENKLCLGADRDLDTAVTPSSENFITSGAVYSAIAASEERINSYLDEMIGMEPEAFIALKELASQLSEEVTAVQAISELVNKKQDILESGLNIKSINGLSLLGSGNLEIGGMTEEERSNLNLLMSNAFPLTVTYISNNAGVREVGTSVTPTATFSCTRQGSSVEPEIVSVTPEATVEGKTWTGSPISSGSVSYTASVTQGGQTKTLPALTWSFTYYRYRGAIDSVPTDFAAAIKALTTKELSTASTLSSTSLAAGKYYLFAVKGNASLVCRHAATDGIIGGCITGKATIQQENGKGTNEYSYILIPASQSTWSFKITNS